MPENKKTFYLGRYYFDSLFRDLANASFLQDLVSEPTLEEGNTLYALAEIQDHSDDSIFPHVKGVFTKVKVVEPYSAYSRENNALQSEAITDRADGQVIFIAHLPSHLVFVEKSPKIKPELFKSRFKKIYTKNSSIAGAKMEFDYLFNEVDVYQEVAGWQRITKVIFNNLRPSNPKMEPLFENIDRMMRETRSKSTKLEFKADEDNEKAGLDLESTLIKESLALASYGYGEGKFIGFDGDLRRVVETENFMKTVLISPENSEELLNAVKEAKDNEGSELE